MWLLEALKQNRRPQVHPVFVILQCESKNIIRGKGTLYRILAMRSAFSPSARRDKLNAVWHYLLEVRSRGRTLAGAEHGDGWVCGKQTQFSHLSL